MKHIVSHGALYVAFVISAACGPDDSNIDLDRQTAAAKGKEKPPSGLPTLSSITFSANSVEGGSPATGTVTFDSITDGAVVSLTSSHPDIVRVPSTVVVPGQQSQGFFAIETDIVSAPTAVTITASAFGVTRTGIMTIEVANSPPVSDTVTIVRARFARRQPRGGVIEIEATSTQPSAILTVEFPEGGVLFRLENEGGGRYSGSRPWNTNPGDIVVRSNFGGSAEASL